MQRLGARRTRRIERRDTRVGRVWIATVLPCAALLAASGLGFRYYLHNHEVVRRIPVAEATVALTFDDGPHPEFTPAVLEILERHGAQATFFLVGEDALAHPEVVRAIRDAGHEVGNHSYTHPRFLRLLPKQAEEEMKLADEAIAQVTGETAFWYRPPYGQMTLAQKKYAAKTGRRIALWNHCVEDGLAVTGPQACAERIVESVGPGDTILAHDGRLDRTATLEALEAMLAGLSSRGYRVTSLSGALED